MSKLTSGYNLFKVLAVRISLQSASEGAQRETYYHGMWDSVGPRPEHLGIPEANLKTHSPVLDLAD